MAGAFEQYRAKLDKALYEKNAFTDVLQTIEDKTGVKRIYIVGGAIAVVALWLIFGYAAAFLSTFLGFVYPAYMSVKAIESERKDDDTQWLTYWVVFGVFSLCEFFTDIFLSWFPFYYLFKMLFLGWCMAPMESNGANLLYHRFIKPFVLKHEREIDDSLGKVTDIASSTLNEAQQMAKEAAADAAAEQVRKAMEDQKSDPAKMD
ncbi:Receptor expression-enhancing protein 5 [Holothuria leucospilota]|uniref:Receptor expression-enhancing protein n=1 Tax=Holothuria leucospilota TaxID=206669 RepID=A0A9Q1BMM9_HOLLE|nr:Receptor expression-enhancing protein 5 [Holothuria leucospilota]